jgi:hypothetical protein
MIEVKIPKEITNYKEKLFFNLTLRQTLSVVIALLINIPLYIYGRTYIKPDILSWIIIVMALPILFCGFFKYNGLTFEKFVLVVILHSFIYPQIRIYKTENPYDSLICSNKNKGGTKNVFIKKKNTDRKNKNTKNSPTDNTI